MKLHCATVKSSPNWQTEGIAHYKAGSWVLDPSDSGSAVSAAMNHCRLKEALSSGKLKLSPSPDCDSCALHDELSSLCKCQLCRWPFRGT